MITMILVCAADYFRKKSENVEMSFFFKKKKLLISENLEVGCFSSRLDGFEITCTSIRKKTARKPLFSIKNFDFCIF